MSEVLLKIRKIIEEEKFFKVIALFLVLVGFGLRLYWVIKIPNEPISDYKTYYDIAVSIVNGETHPLLGYQGIGYPLLLALFFYLFGSTDILIAKLVNVAFSTATLIIVYMISRKLFKDKIIALIVLLLMVILPNYIAYNNVLGTETFFLFLFTTIILVFLGELNNKMKFPLLGILIGLAALTKPQFMIYPIILAIIYYFKNRTFKETILKFSIVGVFMAIVIAPMTILNYKNHGEFIPVSYNGGYVLYINNNSQNSNGMYMDVAAVEPTQNLMKNLQDIGIEHGTLNAKAAPLYQEAATQWIMEHPVDFFKVGLLRVKATFFSGASDIQIWSMSSWVKTLEEQLPWSEYARNIYTFTFLTDIIIFSITIFGFLFTILGGIYFLLKLKKGNIPYVISIPTINIMFFILISFCFEGQSRYNYPVLFLFIIGFVFIFKKLVSSFVNLNIENFE
ncbi:glycosyltransferase family 39 protein [Lysinibacillus sp. fls2-241-R2A-57]|uniref:glycosyltransferase family 39 protein n=1 Tax=Lysinibacillus sp. fls2-241-R2A-57 TaxID=3040292 RepID=UPI002555676A|nr:glycosyltransferase family 39 protein [Lysinibacillus sp. fls2-241-R2A-57]